jgi:hypothetical protein
MSHPPVNRRQAVQLLGAAAAAQTLAAQTPDICFLSAVEMASLIRRRKLSAREVMSAHLKQVSQVNQKVNAIITLTAEQATENARKADEAQAHGSTLGPLHGLPVVHKDLFDTAGVRTTYGSRILKDNVPKQDAIIVERIAKAGAISIGKSNTPECGAGSDLFPDNWIYIHDPRVRVGRVQNYTNWSPEMTPDPSVTSLGLEYFCAEGDTLWNMTDEDLIALAGRELHTIGLVRDLEILDATVIRVPKAYPVYNASYRGGLAVVREFLKTIPNLQLVGRNGQHRYNNQDHSMLAGLLAARNVMGARFNLWDLNTDQDFQEEGVSITDEELNRMEVAQPTAPEMVL